MRGTITRRSLTFSCMGFGLSVCMTIVKAHKGSMKAENREEGGARVMFWLPKGMESENGN